MSKYRKKQIVVEAEQATKWMRIPSDHGIFVVKPGEWVITGVKGERYPCADDVFKATYEKVDEDASAAE